MPVENSICHDAFIVPEGLRTDSDTLTRRDPIHLTPRETQILKLVAQGLSNRRIAKELCRSIKTVEKHRQSVNDKLHVRKVTGLTRYALSIGLISEDKHAPPGVPAFKPLTPRQAEILKLVAEGLSNKRIADELRRSIKTVDHHREHIMKRLNIHDIARLTRYAVSLGLVAKDGSQVENKTRGNA